MVVVTNHYVFSSASSLNIVYLFCAFISAPPLPPPHHAGGGPNIPRGLDADVAQLVSRCCTELNVDPYRYAEMLCKNLFFTWADVADISLDEFLLMDFPLKLAKTIRRAFTGRSSSSLSSS